MSEGPRGSVAAGECFSLHGDILHWGARLEGHRMLEDLCSVIPSGLSIDPPQLSLHCLCCSLPLVGFLS